MKQVLGAVACAVCIAVPAQAQLNGLPVFVSPKGGTGFTLAFDYGRGMNDESGRNTAVGARASLGLGPVSFGVGAGTVNPVVNNVRQNELQYMGNASIRVIGSALVPVAVSLFAGAGVLDTDLGSGNSSKQTFIPIGVGFALNLPTPGFTFEPWVAPRVSLNRVSATGPTTSASTTQTGFGLSAGLGLGFAMGLGLHVALDWTDLNAQTLFSPNDILARQPAVFGVGLNYTFRLPGLGVPLAPGI